MGQMFYSMSLAMGIMITYGSYTKDEVSIVKSVNQIEIFDTGIAILAGMMVVPAVYIFSGEAGTSQSGAGLMFVTLPKVFTQMTAGRFIGGLFLCLCFCGTYKFGIRYGSNSFNAYRQISYKQN